MNERRRRMHLSPPQKHVKGAVTGTIWCKHTQNKNGIRTCALDGFPCDFINPRGGTCPNFEREGVGDVKRGDR